MNKSAFVWQFLSFGLLVSCSSPAKHGVQQDSGGRKFQLKNPEVIGKTTDGSNIHLGAFSGLWFEGRDAKGRLTFLTHPDRGPNGLNYLPQGGSKEVRPFLLPNFQLRWIRFALNESDQSIEILEQIGLTKKDGKPVTGLPNMDGVYGLAYADETPVGPDQKPLKMDPLGLDLEGMCRAKDGSVWMVDEYRPSLVHFSKAGKMIERFVPEGTLKKCRSCGKEALPRVYAQRRPNRGFEGVACGENRIFAFIQSPLDNPNTVKNITSKRSRVVRVLEFDPLKGKTTGQYLYLFDDDASDKKVGDALLTESGDFLLLEQTSSKGEKTNKKVYKFKIGDATNIHLLADREWEAMAPDEIQNSGVKVISKTLAMDLGKRGYNFNEKAEGMALIDGKTLAIAADNDFNVANTEDTTVFLVELE